MTQFNIEEARHKHDTDTINISVLQKQWILNICIRQV